MDFMQWKHVARDARYKYLVLPVITVRLILRPDAAKEENVTNGRGIYSFIWERGLNLWNLIDPQETRPRQRRLQLRQRQPLPLFIHHSCQLCQWKRTGRLQLHLASYNLLLAESTGRDLYPVPARYYLEETSIDRNNVCYLRRQSVRNCHWWTNSLVWQFESLPLSCFTIECCSLGAEVVKTYHDKYRAEGPCHKLSIWGEAENEWVSFWLGITWEWEESIEWVSSETGLEGGFCARVPVN